ncbi:hypothetical protein, conserved [Trypanosoma brucei gambiense DAL972]|uniref:Methyltransferase type 11 domain-containing protein n=1 Tax=Trypanosoma brucei gambiense (strain MHOM/CI/86/DAL972) TaxID=679716 RepID=C9ZZD3_TRYB9|nr:hypothetical protein, conserved [Trypanosoma brucei gambiense DAL972]CBH14782.1 hypothetical protein, conserved [Trypanosoma brucei gambiense DAL972]|eukprot:XP_011777048.1 hypothetical protein, conserved [Trypanosoma brucei gambiense DAL972]
MRSIPYGSKVGELRRGFVSAFSPALHGYHRGCKGFFPEPAECWLAILTDSVPFYRNSLVICPSFMDDERLGAITRRSGEHFPGCRVAALRRRIGVAASSPCCRAEGSGEALQVKGGRLPHFVSPLETVAPSSLDAVIFAGNVFGEEMLHDAPWHLSLAHRCLRPHGVVAVMGYSPVIRVVAPEAARNDADDFLKDLVDSARAAIERGEADNMREALQRVMDVSSSLDVGHADMYFPFPSVRRRWFCSEYSATPAQVAAAYRCLPEYQLLSTGSRGNSRAPQCSDMEETLICEGGSGDDALNVVRRRCIVDPLEALEGCLRALLISGGDTAAGKSALRVRVSHFVVTCSTRSINAQSQLPPHPSAVERLPHLK